MPVHTKGGPNPVGLQLWIDLPSEHKCVLTSSPSVAADQ